jgi:acyl-CoA thioesterase YciA
VSFYTHIIKTGNTSITVDVEVFVQRDPENPTCHKVTEATLTYVAVNKNRKPRPLPSAD